MHLTVANKTAEFPGGKKAWQDFLRANINITIPVSQKAPTGTYQTMIRFIVGSDGKLRDIGADANCGFGMESEVIRCIKKSVNWIPAETSYGKKVAFTFRSVVIFNIYPREVGLILP